MSTWDVIEHAERRFNKLINDIKNNKTDDDQNHDENLTNNLKDSFRALTDLYIKKNEWSRFFSLVDLIEQTIQSKCSETNPAHHNLDEMLRLVADVFYSVNYRPMAFEYYKKAIRLSCDANLFALESVENLIDECMERWHYRMINDSVRNRAYSMAIFKRLERLRLEAAGREIRVLDIGSGTGLLSALCLSNAYNFGLRNIRIYACEENDFFFQISYKFLKSIDKSNQIKVINKNSHELELQEDLDGNRIDLIVTEIFDDGLLGEGCLPTLYNALYVQKLARPMSQGSIAGSSRLITQSARLFICAVESARLRRSSRYAAKLGDQSSVTARCLNNSERFENEFESSELNFEPYTSENLNYYDDIECLTQPEEIAEFRVRFDDEKFLERLCKLGETIKSKKHLKATRSGTLDALVVWFELYLDEEIVLTNCPLGFKKSKLAQTCHCWDQAVYNVSKPVEVVEGQLIATDCKLRSDCFMISLIERNNTNEPKDTGLDLWLSEFEMRLLNNRPYQLYFSQWLERELQNIPECTETPRRDLVVGYLSNSFSEVFFELVFEHKTFLETKKNVNLKIEVFVNLDQDFSKYLASTVQEKFPHIQLHFMNELKTKQTYHLDYLIYEPLDVKFGVLKKHLIAELVLIKSCNSNKHMKMFPQTIRLKSTMIESDSLLKSSQLESNKNLCIEPFDGVQKIDLEPFLLDFYTRQQYSLSVNTNTPSYKQLTEIVDVLEFDVNQLEKIEYDVRNAETRPIESGRIDFVLYWFEMIDKETKRVYSPVLNENLAGPETFWSQLVAFSVSEKRREVDLDKHDVIKFDYLFGNQMFYVRDLIPSKK